MGFLPHGHSVHCIILASRGFATTDALAWCAREHVAVLVVHEGEFLAVTNAAAGRLARQELATRRRQMECVLDPKRRLVAARSLIEAELLSGLAKSSRLPRSRPCAKLNFPSVFKDQLRAFPASPVGRARLRLFTSSIVRALTALPTKACRSAGSSFNVPIFATRFALHPVNAMINYSGAIVVAQCARACAGLGLDPAFGILHSTRPGMVALAWDTYELLRARTETVLGS